MLRLEASPTDPTTASLLDLLADDGGPDEMWHIAADELHDHRADSGMSWLTLCGQMRPPCRKSKPWFGNEPDDCAVCTALAESS